MVHSGPVALSDGFDVSAVEVPRFGGELVPLSDRARRAQFTIHNSQFATVHSCFAMNLTHLSDLDMLDLGR